MKKIYYYTPIIETIANNGSERFGVFIKSKVWQEDNPKMKIDVSVQGKSSDEALLKFDRFITSDGVNQTVKLHCNYYLCSKAVVETMKPFEVSKPFKSGFKDDDDLYFIAWLNFDEVEKHFKEIVEPHNESIQPHNIALKIETKIDFWVRECIPGTMDESKISLKNITKKGLFLEISEKSNLTGRNQAMFICNLAAQEGMTPVKLINKYCK
ncbi:hypothetical protein IUY40_02780 [Flavobacterium sp. ALJ2]|uniref:hypothetical protein n=1 Tax=Flavobacterium sp. ALJ2 TaxID=2786960 RepID=UPI0018A090AA|nr:hypothetical protein [Flavobacterium sp. ALJ2]MBF7090470.1 hypothetical protein [Flavobacterium sp. ALJ2]